MVTSGNADLVGRMLHGRYRLLEPIGRGSSGQVYAAQDTQLQRRVAVKILHQALASDAGFLRRFQIEAQVAASLSHPNIMVVHDSGTDDAMPFMVMELLGGGSLRAMIDEGNLLTPSQAAFLGRDIAQALAYAHKRGIIHRDIKPANLLFDHNGVVKIADFGVARALAEASWTEPMGAMIGTARYASPEQALGVQLDGRSDLYSLALVLVEATAGDLPFDAETPLSMLNVRTQEPIVADPALGPLRAVLERCGQVQRDDRYPDARTVVSALDEVVFAMAPPTPLALVGHHGDGAIDPTTAFAIATAEVISSPADLPTADTSTIKAMQDQVVAPNDDQFVPAPAVGEATSAVAHDDTSRVAVPALPFDQDAGATTRAPTLYDAVAEGHIDPNPQPGTARSHRVTRSLSQRLVPIAVVFAVVAALAGSVAAVAGLGARPAKIVPTVVGLNKDAAVAQLASEELPVRAIERSSEEPAGSVVEQRPAPGTALRDNTTVEIVVSTGTELVKVPRLIGLKKDKALQALGKVGLVAVATTDYDNAHPETIGTVFRLKPASDKLVAIDSTVEFVVSLGHAKVAIPRAVGLPVGPVTDALTKLKFKVKRLPDVFSETVPAGNVVRISLPEASKQPWKSPVSLTVSQGPERVEMPNVIGLAAADACTLITNRGLKCATPLLGPQITGVTTAADYPPGEMLKVGTAIQLTVD